MTRSCNKPVVDDQPAGGGQMGDLGSCQVGVNGAYYRVPDK